MTHKATEFQSAEFQSTETHGERVFFQPNCTERDLSRISSPAKMEPRRLRQPVLHPGAAAFLAPPHGCSEKALIIKLV